MSRLPRGRKRRVGLRSISGLCVRERTRGLVFEPLEDRTMLTTGAGAIIPPAIVVGRTLATYDVPDIQNHQDTITYTVYNEQADPETGVLLTTSLEPGVSVANASPAPDTNGANLAWSLGTIPGFGRESVTLSLTLASPTPTQLDTGAHVDATLDAAAVSNTTPAASLSARAIAPALLASTPDANTTDPFIQEEAAKLSYDPTQIVNFLHNQISYNSYLGSMRGARGTLWSGAGNALDVASLGVALMRASGIPAQYAQGTLSQAQAGQLILTMFPSTPQTVGEIPAGTITSDPASDPTLLSETEPHYWLQFNTGSGMQDFDPLMPGATVGQTFTTATSTFTAVPDALRAKTEVQLVAETTSSAGSLFGGGPTDSTVLDMTFNDVDLVGRPITVGNFVNSSNSGGLLFSTETNTYSPYISLSDEANDPASAEILRGTDYQEVITNFPLASQLLTGLFLNMTLTSPGATPTTYTKTLVDRFGFAARQNGGSPAISADPTAPPILSPLDLTTINVLPGLQSPNVLGQELTSFNSLRSQLAALQPIVAGISATGGPTPAQSAAESQANTIDEQIATDSNQSLGIVFALASDKALAQLQAAYDVKAYYASPRLIVTTSQQSGAQLNVAIDLVKNDTRDVSPPGQATDSTYFFEIIRGFMESTLEGEVVTDATGQTGISYTTVFNELANEGGHLVTITQDNLSDLDTLSLSADAKARIAQEVSEGYGVLTPSQMVTLDGQSTVEWIQFNISTGQLISVAEDGGHQELVEYVAVLTSPIDLVAAAFDGTLVGFANSQLTFLGDFLGNLGSGLSITQIVRQSKLDMIQGIEKDLASVITAAIPIPGGLNAWVALGLAIAQQFGPLAINPQVFNKPVNPADVAQAVIGLLLGQTIESVGSLVTAFQAGLVAGSALGVLWIEYNFMVDPLVPPILSIPLASLPGTGLASTSLPVASTLPTGAVTANVNAPSVAVSGNLKASWSSTSVSNFQTTALSASNAVVKDASGKLIGTGAVGLTASAPVSVAVAGTPTFDVDGQGSLSFYAQGTSTLGVSGNWDSYNATASGNVFLTLTTDSLTLGGQTLPAGTYVINISSASLTGSGASTSPNFAAGAKVTATDSTVNLGAGSGSASVGGKPLDPSNGLTLTGYNGTVTVNPAGNPNTNDSVALNGSATNVMAVSDSPSSITTNENAPATFKASIATSLGDTYTLNAEAPPGWTVAIDGSGDVTVTPASGLQSGTYAIQLVAKSTTDPDLVAQGVVNVTITATQPGITLKVMNDPLFTVPFNGAQIPTAFLATIHNNGPVADTYHVTATNLPAGFTLSTSGTSVTVPPGQTGELGLYLVPTSQIPAAGTQVKFNVTATSTSNSQITQTAAETFTVPAIDAVTETAVTPVVSSTPGTAVNAEVRWTNVGNVAETITPSTTLPTGLASAGLTAMTLAPGQSTSENFTLTPASSAAFNSMLLALINANYGPASAPLTTSTKVSLTVRSPQVLALQDASNAANRGPDSQLASNLSELSDALALLQTTPTDPAALSRVQFLLDNLSPLLQADPALASFVTQFQPVLTASQAGNVSGLLAQSTSFFNTLSPVLEQEADQQFTMALTPGEVDLEPGVGKSFSVQLTDTGPDSETLSLGVGTLPVNVSASLGQSQVTLAPGETTTVTLTMSDTLVSAKLFNLQVNAAETLVHHSATAVVSVEPAEADVLGVTVSPSTPAAGAPVSVSAEIFNAANAPRKVVAKLDVLDSSGNLLSTPAQISVSLVPGAGDVSLNLGQVETTSLANGLYYLRVSLLATDGTAVPGQTSQAAFEVGQPVTASVAASQTIVPPGNSSVTTTISVANETTLGAPVGTPATSGRIVVGHDVNTLSTSGDGPDEETFAVNLATFLAGKSSGKILAIESNATDTTRDYAPGVIASLNKAGFATTVTTSDNFTLAQLEAYNVVFVGESYPSATFLDNSVLTNYVDAGGNVYLYGGVGPDPAAESAGWASFLSNFGLALDSYYNGFTGQLPISSSFPLFTGVTSLFAGIGNSVLDVEPANPHVEIAASDQGQGLYGVYDPQETFSTLPISLELGYTDNLRPNPFFPNPWYTSPNVVFDGVETTTLGAYDGGALRIINNESTAITVNDVSVTLANGDHFDLWGSNVVPAGDSLILVETSTSENFDTSDYDVTLPFPQTYPDGESAHSAQIEITVNGVLLPTFVDTGHVLTTGGSDPGNAGVNESQNWRPVGTTGYTNQGGLSALVTVTHNLPVSGYNVDSTTITPVPTTSSSSQLVWSDEPIPPAIDSGPATFQLTGTVTNMVPGEVRQISTGTSVATSIALSTGQQLNTTIDLAPVTVASEHIISLTPPTQTADLDTTASYTVSLTDPLTTPVTYTLASDGLDDFTPALAPTVTVNPGQTKTTPLTLTVPAAEAAGTYGFMITATTAQGAVDSVEGQLTVLPQVVLPTQAVKLQISPAQASAGVGSPATYVLTVTNVGDVADTYNLVLNGAFPAGTHASFSSLSPDFTPASGTTGAMLTVAPGESNSRQVTLTITSPMNASPGLLPFTVAATSTTAPTVTSSASGSLNVLPDGVGVTLSPNAATPGSPFTVTVTNTGKSNETYHVALGGPAALVATLSTSTVSLAPNKSQQLTVKTGLVNFADAGDLMLMAMATSTTNPAVKAAATSALTIPSTKGFTSNLSPASQTLARPASTSFKLIVNNTGNTEDEYQAVIAGTKGPVTASLVGLNGQPTQAIPLFRLPGLAASALVLDATLSSVGTGVVIVQVKSLSTGTFINMMATVTASGITGTTTKLLVSPLHTGSTGPVTLTAVVSAATTGNVTFVVDGKAHSPGVPLTRVNGQEQATFTIPSLTPGSHTFQASYGGTPTFSPSTSPVVGLVVNAKASDDPRVTNVWRMGYHWAPTTLILGFNVPLKPTSADNPNTYTIIGPDGQQISIISAVYDARSKTVTLHPSERLDLHKTYRLIVSGTGPTALIDAQGIALDGNGSGRPGSNYVTTITMANWTLVLPPPLLPADPPAKPATLDLSLKAVPAGPLVMAKSVVKPLK